MEGSVRIRALVFDFDGLILETETPAFQAWSELYAEHGHELPMDRWLEYIGRDARHFDALEHLVSLAGELDREAIRTRRNARRDELVAALDVMVGVREIVADAKRLGLRLAVASSSPRAYVCGHLERLGIHGDWDAIRCREDVARAKPAPDLFLAAALACGVAPEEAVAFEDSANGVAAAKAAGMYCVAVPNALTASMDLSRADLLLGSLADEPLERVLERLAARERG